jgi:hypothetical protein
MVKEAWHVRIWSGGGGIKFTKGTADLLVGRGDADYFTQKRSRSDTREPKVAHEGP